MNSNRYFLASVAGAGDRSNFSHIAFEVVPGVAEILQDADRTLAALVDRHAQASFSLSGALTVRGACRAFVLTHGVEAYAEQLEEVADNDSLSEIDGIAFDILSRLEEAQALDDAGFVLHGQWRIYVTGTPRDGDGRVEGRADLRKLFGLPVA